jgi:hypothetical protein
VGQWAFPRDPNDKNNIRSLMPPVVYMNYEVLYTGFTHKKLRTILKGLKVKTNEKEGGSGMWQMIDIGLRKR